jgi:hypothetical protein
MSAVACDPDVARSVSETARLDRLMDPAQFYETTLYNRDRDQALAIATVPARSLPTGEVPPVEALGEQLETPGGIIRPVEAWSLPFLIDTALGEPRWPGSPFDAPLSWPLAARPRNDRWSSPFAEYVAFTPVVPFESSPLGAKSLGGLVAGAGGAVGAYATHDPLLLLTVPAGIIVCRAAFHIGDGIGIAVRTVILRWVGVDTEPPDSERHP